MNATLTRSVVGVTPTNLPVAPSFHREVIVVFFYASGVFAACVRAAGGVTSCLAMRVSYENVELVSLPESAREVRQRESAD